MKIHGNLYTRNIGVYIEPISWLCLIGLTTVFFLLNKIINRIARIIANTHRICNTST